jgi:hypothetical protein
MIESAAEFVFLRTSEDMALYQRAAQESASEEVWREVITTYPEMKFWVAQNKTVPLSILDILSRDPNSSVRLMVAQKRKAGAEILERLAQDIDEGVRRAVALNAKTPIPILQRLLRDPGAEIAAIARNRLQEKT